jgi:hypothetical protein
MAGGSGTRLWPLSRAGYPKQFLVLHGNESLLQQAARRLMALAVEGGGACRKSGGTRLEVAPPLVVGNEEHRFLILDQLREAGCTPAALMLEPAGRNTAPAVTLAALQAALDGADPVLVITPADSPELKFPNWRSLLPDVPAPLYKRAVLSRDSISSLGMRSGALLATDFALEACGFGCGFGKDETVRIEYFTEGNMQPMVIKHDLGKAIVMPMRMPGGEDAETLDPRTEADMTPMNPALANLTKKVASGEIEIEINGKKIGVPDDEEQEEGQEVTGLDVTSQKTLVDGVAKMIIDLKLHPDTRIMAIQKVQNYFGTEGLIALKEHKLKRQYSNIIESTIGDLIAAEQEGGEA